MPTFEFEIDDEPYATTEHELTARKLLTDFAKKDPALFYLVQKVGNTTKSYRDQFDEPIHMHQKMVFLTNATGPTPVSGGTQ
jgi:hypothetical protein